jgi:hypothetical protein
MTGQERLAAHLTDSSELVLSMLVELAIHRARLMVRRPDVAPSFFKAIDEATEALERRDCAGAARALDVALPLVSPARGCTA